MPYIGQRPSKGDENNFKILDDISSYTLTFDGSDSSVVSAANDTITSLTHRFVQGQRVTYNKGGGTVIGGLSDGVYYVIKEDHNTIKLATSASNASNGVAVNITGVGSGSSHTLNVAFDGVNTKFKATHTNGQKARITRSAQLVISINGVIQQPHDSATPSTGFGFDLDGTIVFSQAPIATDEYWAHVLTNNNVTFDISDNDVDNFTGDGSTVSFTLSKTPPDNRNVLVTIDGVVQYPNDPDGTVRAYNVVENVLTFAVAPDANVQIQVRHIGFAGSTSGSGGVTSFYGRTGAVVLKNTDNVVVNNATIEGDLTVNGTTTTLDTQLVEVDKIEVETADINVAVAVTHNGSGDLVRLYDGSSQVVTVDDEGNVGIGTVAPREKIDVTAGRIILDEGYQFTWANGTTNRARIHGDSSSNFIVETGSSNSEALRIDSTGKLTHTQTGGEAIDFGTTSASGAYHKYDLSASGATTGYIGAGNQLVVGANVADFAFRSQANMVFSSGGDTEKLRITSNGEVGINSTSPHTKLDVIHSYVNRTWTPPSSGTALFERNGINRIVIVASNTSQSQIDFADTDDDNAGYIRYDHSDNSMSFRTNGSGEKLLITSDGNVGIGTDAPATNLHINAAVPNIRFTDSDTGQYSDISQSGHSLYLSGDRGASGSGGIIFRTQGTDERLRITSDGKVGIGTDNPTTKLQVYSDVPEIKLQDSDGTDQFSQWKQVGGNARLQLRNGSNNGSFTIQGIGGGTATDPFVKVMSNGKVGIGTDNPDSLLHVAGSGIPTIKLQDTDTNGGYAHFEVNGSALFIESYDEDGTEGQILFKNATSESMRIRTDGKVGINTTTPDTFLEVFGGSTSIQVGNQSGLGRFGADGTSTKIGSHSNHHLDLFTNGVANARLRIANNSAATSIGGAMTFNAMLTVQGDISGELFRLKAAGDTTRLMISGIDTSDVEINLYDKNGAQKGILVGGETEFALKAPNNSAPMTFYTHNGSSIGERLRITSTGYVQTKSELWVGGSAPVLRWRDSTHGEKATARIDGSDLYFEVANNERLRIASDGSLYAGGTVITESDLNWTHDTYQRPHIFSGKTGGNPSDGAIVLASPETNPSNTRIGSLLFGCKTSSTSGVSNSGLKGVIECYTNTNVSDAWKTGSHMNFAVRRDNGELENKVQITRDGLVVRRQDTGSEGGEVMLCRPSDDTPHFHIDAFGASGTPSNSNDWVSNVYPTMRIHTGGTEIFKIGTNGNIRLPHNPIFCGVYQDGSGTNVNSDPVIFDDTVYINKGAGQTGSGTPYNTSNGYFTCPSGGYYQVYVQAHLQAQSSTYSTWRIYHNTTIVSNAWEGDTGGGSLVASVIVNASGGDTLRATFISTDTTQYTDETYWVLHILKVG